MSGTCCYCDGACHPDSQSCSACMRQGGNVPSRQPCSSVMIPEATMVVETDSDTQYEIEARALEIAITLLEAQIRELKRRRVAVLHKRIALIDI